MYNSSRHQRGTLLMSAYGTPGKVLSALSMSMASAWSSLSRFRASCAWRVSLPAAAAESNSCVVPQRRISSKRRGPLDEALFLQHSIMPQHLTCFRCLKVTP